MIHRTLLVFLVACLLSSPVTLAATIQWTGGAGNSLWNFASNWIGNAVPTANDDVVINSLGGSTVSISQPAVARSITIAGGSYAQSLTLLSQLTVGAGGITVKASGTLSVQSNNNLPLSSTGPVQVQSGGSLVFQSGSIVGPGTYTINAGADLLFSQTSLKQISATNLTNWGQVTIQPSTIQLSAGAVFINNANLTAIGQVTIFSSDTTGATFQNFGNFHYQGALVAQPLTLQVDTVFGSDLNIVSGAVALAANFRTNSTVSVPAGTILTVSAGQTTKTLNVIKGAGEFIVQGTTIVNGPVSLNLLQITDSGTLTLTTGASFTAAQVGGIVSVHTTLTLTNLTLAGGTVTGTGTTSVSGYLVIGSSDTGNSNNFISSTVILYGQGSITVPVYLLLGTGGILHIAYSATLTILSTITFGIQAGKPLIVVDGTIALTLSTSQQLISNVDISGAGTLKVNSGTLTFNGDVITLGSLFLSVSSYATFQTAVVTIQSITGAGGLNLTAAPSPVSTIGTVALTSFGIPNGAVNIGSFAVSTFNLWNGVVGIASGSTNSATNFNYEGGSLSGAAKLTASALNFILHLPVSISGVAIKTTTLSIQTVGTGSIQLSNGATIIADSSLFAQPARNGVNIN